MAAKRASKNPPLVATGQRSVPEALRPEFKVTSPKPNQGWTLYRGRVDLRAAGAIVAGGAGKVEFRWTPSPGIEFALPARVAAKLFAVPDASSMTIELPALGWKASGFITSLGSAGVRGVFHTGVSGQLVSRKVTRFARLTFLVPNFPSAIGSAVSEAGKGGWWAGRNVFSADGWRVTLDGLRDSRDRADHGQRLGGYTVTHVGSLEREDGKAFTPKQAERALGILALFLSFARGLWTGPMMVTGFDSGGDPVWQEWSPRVRVDQWQYRESWLPLHDDFSTALSGFWTLAADVKLGRALRYAVHWYIEANKQSGAMEGSIVMMQFAFELLAWLELVRRRKFLTRDAFGRLNADDQIRLMLATLRVPLEVPPNLALFAKEAKKLDAARAFTALRNGVVHPPKGDALPEHPSALVQEAYGLGMRWLELLLLRVIGYDGKYHDRLLHRSAVEAAPVPWTV